MNAFWLYAALGAIGIPWAMWRLHVTNAVIENAPALNVVTSTPERPPTVALVTAAVPAQPPARDNAPDLPEVTPHQVKAGEVRRVQGPPCHDCHCCSVYATRIEQAHIEIDKLRDELLDAGQRGLRRAASSTTPSNVVAIRS